MTRHFDDSSSLWKRASSGGSTRTTVDGRALVVQHGSQDRIVGVWSLGPCSGRPLPFPRMYERASCGALQQLVAVETIGGGTPSGPPMDGSLR